MCQPFYQPQGMNDLRVPVQRLFHLEKVGVKMRTPLKSGFTASPATGQLSVQADCTNPISWCSMCRGGNDSDCTIRVVTKGRQQSVCQGAPNKHADKHHPDADPSVSHPCSAFSPSTLELLCEANVSAQSYSHSASLPGQLSCRV